MKQQKLTYEMHTNLGEELYEIRDRLMSRLGQICGVYGKSKKPSKAVIRALDAVDNLRSKMEAQLSCDYPNEFDPHIYFPGQGATKKTEEQDPQFPPKIDFNVGETTDG